MFDTLAALACERRRLVLGWSLLLCLLAAGLGVTVSPRLSSGGYEVTGGESAQALGILRDQFRTGVPNLVLLVETPKGADDERTARVGEQLTRNVAAQPGVQGAASYWSLDRVPVLRSRGGDSALVLVSLKGAEDEVNRTLEKLRPQFQGSYDGLRVRFGGEAETARALNTQSKRDLLLAESVVTPLLLLLLVFVFRGVIAACLPLVLGFVAILGALAVLRVLVSFTDVSIFAMNLTTGLGLGLGIDYSLFVLTRYREELAEGGSVEQAIATSLRTAGRTVLFSALTVGLSLSGLLLFPMYFLRSFAYAGIAVVTFAALSTLILLPALLAIVGRRIDKWSWQWSKPRRAVEASFWHRLAMIVMRWPIPLATAVIVLLLFLGAPFLHIRFSLADARELPRSAEAHQVQSRLVQGYSAREADPVMVVAGGIGSPQSHADAITNYGKHLSELAGVARVDALTGSFAGGAQIAPATKASQRFAAPSSTWLSVVPSVDPYSGAGQSLVREVRAAKRPWPVRVGGIGASFHDTMDSLTHRIPYSLGVIVVSTFVLLFLLSGSVLVPFKALVLNMLSLTATFGAMVWVFQEGHLGSLLGGFTVTGAVVAIIPVMIFCMAFGLSMDYEVFLISRIKEEYEATMDNTAAVARGLERTGGLITAAAALMALVLISFVTSGVTFMKLLGLGLTLAILIDATLVRGVLVPALMRLAGHANWWAPAPLARLHQRFGLSESVRPAPTAADSTLDGLRKRYENILAEARARVSAAPFNLVSLRRLRGLPRGQELMVRKSVVTPATVEAVLERPRWGMHRWTSRKNIALRSKERRQQLLTRLMTADPDGVSIITVASQAGGVGKTTIAAYLATLVARHRTSDRVFAMDINPDAGRLSVRMGVEGGLTLRQTCANRHQLTTYATLHHYFSYTPAGVAVIGSDPSVDRDETFGEAGYREIVDTVSVFANVLVNDCGTNLLHPLTCSAMARTDQLVYVTDCSQDGLELTRDAFDTFESKGYEEQVQTSVLVLNKVKPGSPVELFRETFGSRCRHILTVRHDELLSQRRLANVEVLDLSDAEVVNDLLELTATVLTGLAGKVSTSESRRRDEDHTLKLPPEDRPQQTPTVSEAADEAADQHCEATPAFTTSRRTKGTAS